MPIITKLGDENFKVRGVMKSKNKHIGCYSEEIIQIVHLEAHNC
jgi:hypothetical protein